MGFLTDIEDSCDLRATASAAPRDDFAGQGLSPSPRSAEILQVLNRLLDTENAANAELV